MAKNNTLLWVGGAGIAGLLVYEWWKGNQGTAAAVTNTAPGLNSIAPPPGSLTTELPISVANTGVGMPLQLTVPNLAAAGPPNGIDPTVYTVVQKWGTTDGRAPVMAMLAAAVPSEYAGMYDIIVNAWDAGVQITQTQDDFWNNLRAKYDPQHLSW